MIIWATLGVPGAERRLRWCDEALAVDPDSEDPWWGQLGTSLDVTGEVRLCRGHALLVLGRRTDYEANLEELMELAESTGGIGHRISARNGAAGLVLLDGRFRDALTSAPFGTYFRNTIIITTLATLGSVVSSSLVAYSFARLRWPGRDAWFLIVLGTMMLPGIVTLIPQYILFAKLGWVNTIRPLVVPSWLATDAFYVFLLRQFFRSIPMELSEAAKIDGASELRIWWQIVTPLSRPALAAVTIFAFNGTWGDYLKPLIYLSTEDKYTLQLGLTTFQQSAGGLPRWDWMMAASLVVMLPVVILFFAFQKYFIEGVTMTGIKR